MGRIRRIAARQAIASPVSGFAGLGWIVGIPPLATSHWPLPFCFRQARASAGQFVPGRLSEKSLQEAKDKHFLSRCPAPRVESRTGALTIGCGGYSVAFASGFRLRPSPFLRWVGPRIARFEACSTFTRVPARMFAEPPYAAL